MEYQYQAKLSTMEYHRFSRKRKDYFRYCRSKKNPVILCDIDRQIENTSLGFFDNHAGGALHKAWKGYVIAKKKDEYDNMKRYAVLFESQYDLGLSISSFDNIACRQQAFYGN